MTEELKQSVIREIKNLQGWMQPERAAELAELVTTNKPQVCVEIGVFGGQSLVTMALALKENGSGVVYGIDPWKVEAALEGENEANREWWSKKVDLENIHRGTMEAIWRLGLDSYAIVIRAMSQDAYRLFSKIDLLIVDGNHAEVPSCRDVALYLPLVAEGGHVIADDVDWPTTQKAVSMLNAQCDVVKTDGHYTIYRKRWIDCLQH